MHGAGALDHVLDEAARRAAQVVPIRVLQHPPKVATFFVSEPLTHTMISTSRRHTHTYIYTVYIYIYLYDIHLNVHMSMCTCLEAGGGAVGFLYPPIYSVHTYKSSSLCMCIYTCTCLEAGGCAVGDELSDDGHELGQDLLLVLRILLLPIFKHTVHTFFRE